MKTNTKVILKVMDCLKKEKEALKKAQTNKNYRRAFSLGMGYEFAVKMYQFGELAGGVAALEEILK